MQQIVLLLSFPCVSDDRKARASYAAYDSCHGALQSGIFIRLELVILHMHVCG